MNVDNAKTVSQILKVAAYLMDNPELPYASYGISCNRIDIWPRDGIMTPADVIRKYGAMEKVAEKSSDLFILRQRHDGFTVEWNFQRDKVCKKVEKSRTTIPAREAKTVTLSAIPAREVIEYEWECPESLLRDPADVLHSAAEAVAEATGEPLPTVPLTDEQIQAAESSAADADAEAGYEQLMNDPTPRQPDPKAPF